MVLKTMAFAILNGELPGSTEDHIEAFQFIVDNAYVDELSPLQTMQLRDLVESATVRSPVLFLTLGE